jgi:hypothetical protein
VINLTAKLNRQLAYTANLEIENKLLKEKVRTLESKLKDSEREKREMRETISDLQSDDE